MRGWYLPLSLLTLVSGAVVAGGLFFVQGSPQQSLEAAEPPAWDAVAEVLAAREAELEKTPEANFGSATQINILAIGLDSRKEGMERHCDAIHMLTLDIEDWSVVITSVPRGTEAKLPPGDYAETDYYLANACAYGGLDYGIAQIEQIVGVQADYVATVGFSQALGIFRLLDLPTTETLQWLRHRRSYQIGDPQRSHNQGLFIKDTGLKILSGDGISAPLLHLMYTLVDTDLDYGTAQALYNAYRAADLAARPDDVRLVMKPPYATVDMHYNPGTVDQDVNELIESLRGRVSGEDLSYMSLDELQVQLETYLRSALAATGTVEHVYDEQLWRQVEDEDVREELHFRFMEKYVKELREENREAAIELVTDYVLEKEYFNLHDWAEKGRDFLSTLLLPVPQLI